MAKSTGNNILPREILTGESPFLSKAFSPSVARFFMLQAHYRSVLDFSDDAIVAAEKGYNRLMEALGLLNEIKTANQSTVDVASWKQWCYDAMNDDFNTPILIAHLFEGVRFINILNDGSTTITASDLEILKTTINAFVFDVLGLTNEKETGSNTQKLEGVVHMLINMRNEARANKNFAMSDQIRDQLIAIGIQLKDGKDGTTFSL